MPVTTEKNYQTFTKRISKNDIAPKDGSEPLTVVEFSLTNDIRDSLKKAIDAYCKEAPSNADLSKLIDTKGIKYFRMMQKHDDRVLAQIIKDHFPPEVLEELGQLANKDGIASTVYVVKNLPEMSERKIQNQISKRDSGRVVGDSSDKLNVYCSYISRGVGLALGLDYHAGFHIERKAGVSEINGTEAHTHFGDVSMLAVAKTDGAATRFIDMRTVLEDPDLISRTSKAMPVMEVSGSDNNGNGYVRQIPLAQIPDVFPNWRDHRSMGISPLEKTASAEKIHHAQLIEKHSKDVVIGKGDMALWLDHKTLFHQALLQETPQLPYGKTIRYGVVTEFTHPTNSR